MSLELDSNDLLDELELVSRQLIEEVNDLRPNQAELKPAPDQWSPKEVLCHLHDADQIYIQRMQKMLQEQGEEPLLRAFNAETLAKENDYQSQDWSKALREFITMRQQALKLFKELRLGQWYKAGMHQELGRINMFDIAQNMVEHTTRHLEQVRKAKSPA